MATACELQAPPQRGESHRGDPAAMVGVGFLPQLLLDRALARVPRSRARARTPGGDASSSGPEEEFFRDGARTPPSRRSTTTHDLDSERADGEVVREGRSSGENGERAKMIPDTEAACQTYEVAVNNGDAYQRIKDRPEGEAASVTAWRRYQRLVAAMESRGGEFNRRSAIEAIFRGSDLVYASH